MTIRRRLLACIPLGLAPSAAGAFRLETPAVDLAADYGAASCREPGLHDRLLPELEARLDGRPVPPALAGEIRMLSRCPSCGCAVTGAADHGEATPPPPG